MIKNKIKYNTRSDWNFISLEILEVDVVRKKLKLNSTLHNKYAFIFLNIG